MNFDLNKLTVEQRLVLVKLLQDGDNIEKQKPRGPKQLEKLFEVECTLTCSLCGTTFKETRLSADQKPIKVEWSSCARCEDVLKDKGIDFVIQKLFALVRRCPPDISPYRTHEKEVNREKISADDEIDSELSDLLDEFNEV